MLKFSELNTVWKSVTSAGAVISAIAIIFAGVTWAADTRYQTLVAQELHILTVSQEKSAAEIRQLKRDIARLLDENGDVAPEDRSFSQYLQQDLERLQQLQ